MEYKSSIVIKNSSQKSKKLFLEPWAEEFEIGSGKTFEFVAKADQEGNFEVEFGEDEYLFGLGKVRLSEFFVMTSRFLAELLRL